MEDNQSRLTINNPCSAKWNDMLAAEGGKYCASCSKVVFDFSQKTNEEIVEFLKSTPNSICGKIHSTKLIYRVQKKSILKSNTINLYFGLFLTGLSSSVFGFQNKIVQRNQTINNTIQFESIKCISIDGNDTISNRI
jgi:hypothetical protein